MNSSRSIRPIESSFLDVSTFQSPQQNSRDSDKFADLEASNYILKKYK